MEISQGILNRIASKFIGSSNSRFLRKLQPKIEAINAMEPDCQAMSDQDLHDQTLLFRRRLNEGETLDDLLVEAFAVCREAGRRTLGMRHYDVQLLAGMVIHDGHVAEVGPGEGKSLALTLPTYLDALKGEGTHVVAVDDPRAENIFNRMEPLYDFLGLTTGVIYGLTKAPDRRNAYSCDVTFSSYEGFAFDYLRDNLRCAAREDECWPIHMRQIQRKLRAAYIDDIDQILIDNVRTPMIITTGKEHDDEALYLSADHFARLLTENVDYEVTGHDIRFTEEGENRIEEILWQGGIQASEHNWLHPVSNALKANRLYFRDVHYVIGDDVVVLIDEVTGSLRPDKTLSGGLHQAIEVKENVRISPQSKVLANANLSDFFSLYDRIAGIATPALAASPEFNQFYDLQVVSIPANRKTERVLYPDFVFRTERERDEAVLDEIDRVHQWDVLIEDKKFEHFGVIERESEDAFFFRIPGQETVQETPKRNFQLRERRGRPILVVVDSIETSERISAALRIRGIEHRLYNGKFPHHNTSTISIAGRMNAVTVATQTICGEGILLGGDPEGMAMEQLHLSSPRSVFFSEEQVIAKIAEIEQEGDIKKQKQEVLSRGGLYVIGVGRRESRRNDIKIMQLCGRQGEPGSCRFFLSLEDSLMKIFGGSRVQNLLNTLGMQEGEVIESRMVSRRIGAAQKKRMIYNFDILKELYACNKIPQEQRRWVYEYRQSILEGADCKKLVMDMINQLMDDNSNPNWIVERSCDMLGIELEPQRVFARKWDRIKDIHNQRIARRYDEVEVPNLTRKILLALLDEGWQSHLQAIDEFRTKPQNVNDDGPMQQFEQAAGDLYDQFRESYTAIAIQLVFYPEQIEKDFFDSLTAANSNQKEALPVEEETTLPDPVIENPDVIHEQQVFRRQVDRTNSNDPCPCGSGKKYRKCCGIQNM